MFYVDVSILGIIIHCATVLTLYDKHSTVTLVDSKTLERSMTGTDISRTIAVGISQFRVNHPRYIEFN